MVILCYELDSEEKSPDKNPGTGMPRYGFFKIAIKIRQTKSRRVSSGV